MSTQCGSLSLAVGNVVDWGTLAGHTRSVRHFLDSVAASENFFIDRDTASLCETARASVTLCHVESFLTWSNSVLSLMHLEGDGHTGRLLKEEWPGGIKYCLGNRCGTRGTRQQKRRHRQTQMLLNIWNTVSQRHSRFLGGGYKE